MLVDFAREAERDRGLSSEELILGAWRMRFRPILMTTLCALFAGVPLMLGTGNGSELRQPLGYAMVGGLLVSKTSRSSRPLSFTFTLIGSVTGWYSPPEGRVALSECRP